MLYSAIEQAPSAELVEPDFLTRYFATFDEQFFHYCDKELAKINTFYSGLYSCPRFAGKMNNSMTKFYFFFFCRKTS